MKQIKLVLIVVLALIAAALIVAACNQSPAPVTSQGIGVTRFNSDVEANQRLTVKGAVDFDYTFNVDGAATFNGAAGLSSLSIGSVAQTGAVRSGSASTVISGTTIAHGIGTTPTAFFLTPGYAAASVYTQTLFPHGCNTTSCTVGVSSGSVATFTLVYWLAQR